MFVIYNNTYKDYGLHDLENGWDFTGLLENATLFPTRVAARAAIRENYSSWLHKYLTILEVPDQNRILE